MLENMRGICTGRENTGQTNVQSTCWPMARVSMWPENDAQQLLTGDAFCAAHSTNLF